MKPRRVFVTLKLTTDIPLATLKRAAWWNNQLFSRVKELDTTDCEQAQANVSQTRPAKKRRK